ncbi:MAG TPA: hypothetical protein VNC84_05100 [Gammaproteobacteria bacterium]|jgi:hypothetical protein|nr:hypothetical protein [Gammaproteobacteria bacterium]
MTSQYANKKNKSRSDIKYYRRIKLTHYLSMFLVVAQSFDKAILSLSIASLGFTFAFLKLEKNHLVYMKLLELSWLFFVLAIISVVIALIFTEKYALHRVRFHSSKMLASKVRVKLVRCRDQIMSFSQYLSALFFIVAVILFTIFVWLNIE